jgi:hypothetical protein
MMKDTSDNILNYDNGRNVGYFSLFSLSNLVVMLANRLLTGLNLDFPFL